MLTKRQMLKDTARKLLIIGGFIGLIFSKAEGVSLLPFPSAETAASSEISLQTVGADNKYSYSQTVKRTNSVKSHKGKSKNFEPAADTTVSVFDESHTVSLAQITPALFQPAVNFSVQLSGTTATRGPPSLS